MWHGSDHAPQLLRLWLLAVAAPAATGVTGRPMQRIAWDELEWEAYMDALSSPAVAAQLGNSVATVVANSAATAIGNDTAAAFVNDIADGGCDCSGHPSRGTPQRSLAHLGLCRTPRQPSLWFDAEYSATRRSYW